MNILIAHCGKGIFGGAELVIVELAKYLHRQGHEVRIVAKNIPANLCDSLHSSVSCHQENTYWGLRNAVQRSIGWADVINVHNFPATLTIFPVRTKTKAVVWMCNEPAELFTNWWRKPIEAFNRWWMRASKMGVVVADSFNANRFERIYKVKPQVIPYGVDYKFWAGGATLSNNGVVRLLQAGTISPYKNQLESLFILKGLVERRIDATLTLAGAMVDNHYNALLRSHLNRDLIDRVYFLGHQSRKNIRELYYTHDVLLHPVLEQGGWLSPFEAMCAGLPVVTIPAFTASGIIINNRLGIVTDNMLEAVANGDYKKLDTVAIKLWVKGNLSWDKFGEEMINVYKANIRE